jgi:cobalt-zinc-cadmium efflux system protein
LTSGQRLATLHVRLAKGAIGSDALAAVRTMLQARFAIEHSTIEVDGDTAEVTTTRCPEPPC